MKTDINRRNFIKNTVIGSAGLFMIPNFISASGRNFSEAQIGKNMMSGLTPISIIDNACMLAFCSGEVSQKTQNILTTDIHLRDTPGNKGRLAVVLPPNDTKLLSLVQIVRDWEDALRGTDHADEKRAISFGWTGVNAVHRYINPDLQNKDNNEQVLARIHQDAIVVNGFSNGYNINEADKEEVEALLNAMLTRTITRIHTLKPDADDGIGWVNRMTEWRRKNVETMSHFSEAIIKPNIDKAGKMFYDANDEIIEMAIQLQNGKFIKPSDVMKSITNSEYKSNYAKSLVETTQNIIAIDKYLNRKISRTQLQAALKV